MTINSNKDAKYPKLYWQKKLESLSHKTIKIHGRFILIIMYDKGVKCKTEFSQSLLIYVYSLSIIILFWCQ